MYGCDSKYIHIVVQPSLPSTSRTFSSPATEILKPIKQYTLIPPPLKSLVTIILLSVSKILTIILTTSYKWTHTIALLLYLAYFT